MTTVTQIVNERMDDPNTFTAVDEAVGLYVEDSENMDDVEWQRALEPIAGPLGCLLQEALEQYALAHFAPRANVEADTELTSEQETKARAAVEQAAGVYLLPVPAVLVEYAQTLSFTIEALKKAGHDDAA